MRLGKKVGALNGDPRSVLLPVRLVNRIGGHSGPISLGSGAVKPKPPQCGEMCSDECVEVTLTCASNLVKSKNQNVLIKNNDLRWYLLIRCIVNSLHHVFMSHSSQPPSPNQPDTQPQQGPLCGLLNTVNRQQYIRVVTACVAL